jgi:DNA-binding IscR family transcriptional regulator
MECASEEEPEDVCPLIEGCATRVVWLKVRDNIIEALDSTTLGDLVTSNRRGSQNGAAVTIDSANASPARR